MDEDNLRMPATYRWDIDGLRAIAVLAVIGYHWNIKPLQGGYVGVDIFFVISGYLITRIIFEETYSGKFSFGAFYERRVRRLIPALYAMVVGVFALAWLFLWPSDFTAMGASIAAVVTFTSNILFWSQTGYFDAAALTKPLLHTWSLAVEEQFYLAFPFVIWILASRRANRWVQVLPWVAIAITGASFALNAYEVNRHMTAAFYLSPGRAWEFLCGALIAIRPSPSWWSTRWRLAALPVGLAMIFWAIFKFTQTTAFPGINALVPCLGTTLVIAADISSVSSVITPTIVKPWVFIGQISYSLYLWHWPAIVFAKIALGRTGALLQSEIILLFLLTLIVSWLSFALIEQPVRQRAVFSTRHHLFVAASAISAILILASVTTIELSGFPSRFDQNPTKMASFVDYDYKAAYRLGTCFIQDEPADDYDPARCFSPELGKTNLLIWGDSLAAHLAPGFREAAPANVRVMQAGGAQCPPFPGVNMPVVTYCNPLNQKIMNLIHERPPDLVILSGNWNAYNGILGFEPLWTAIDDSVRRIELLGSRVVLIGPTIQFQGRVPLLLAKKMTEGLEPRLDATQLAPGIFDLDLKMKIAANEHQGLSYVSILEAMCPFRDCPSITNDNTPMLRDDLHLTAKGSAVIARHLYPLLPVNAKK